MTIEEGLRKISSSGLIALLETEYKICGQDTDIKDDFLPIKDEVMRKRKTILKILLDRLQ